MRKLLLICAALLWPSICHAQVQWNYTFDNSGTALASYLGNVKINQNLTISGTVNGVINIATTGNNFQNSGAIIQRINDRIFLGGATVNDGNYPNVTKDWLTQFQVNAGLANGTGIVSSFFDLNNTNSAQGATIVAGCHTQYLTTTAQGCQSISSYLVIDNTSNTTTGWAFYGECHNTSSLGIQAVCMELDARSTVSATFPNPYQIGSVNGIQLDCGAGLASTGHPCSAGLTFGANPETWDVGIVFNNGSLTTSGGLAQAIQFDQGDYMQWYTGGGTPTSAIIGNVSNYTLSTKAVFDNTGFSIQNQSSTNILNLNPSTNLATFAGSIQDAGETATGTVIFSGLTSDAGQTDATVCRKTTGGQLYYGSGTLGVCLGTSSERYKHGLEPLKPGLNEVIQLHPVRGFLNPDKGDPNRPYYWITAEDGYKAVPELVGLDAQGRPNTFDLIGLVPVLVNSIQALQDEVASLNKRQADDEARIKALEYKISKIRP